MKPLGIGLSREQREKLPPMERRNYLLALITMASVDDEISEEELDLIKRRATDFNCRIKKSDLKKYDIVKIAEGVRTPSLRDVLFQDLIEMARADRRWLREELSLLRYLSEAWDQSLPGQPFPGMDWRDIVVPSAEEIQETSVRKRNKLANPQNKKILQSAEPGIQWAWVFAATGIYLLIALLFYVLKGESPQNKVAGSGELTLLDVVLGLLPSFLAGFIFGVISPVPTLKEAGIGVSVPVLVTGMIICFLAIKDGMADDPEFVEFILIVSVTSLIQFGCAIFGAYISRAEFLFLLRNPEENKNPTGKNEEKSDD